MIGAVILAITLGIDVFAGGLSLGAGGVERRRWPGIALLFAVIAFLMTTIGVLFGRLLSDDFGSHASYIAGAVLLVVGMRAIADAWFGEKDDKAVSEVLGIYTIAMTGVMVCIDKLAIGFSMAFIDDLSIPGAIAVLVVISFVATLIGMSMGKRLGTNAEHIAEYVAGAIFIALGLLVIWQTRAGGKIL